MELYQLRGFVAVAELGHLTRAAERLHLSQPALSAQIKALEDELGLQLFERNPAGMALTAAGKRLLPEATKILDDAAALHGKARAIQGEVAGHVREGALDASFYYGDLTHPAGVAIPLREFAYRLAGPAAWRDRIAAAPWEAIASLPWIMAPAISTHRVLATRLFAERGSAPSTLIEADNEFVIRSLVASELGVALVREDLAREGETAGELVVWAGARLATTLRFIYSAQKREEPELRALVGIIGDVWHDTIAPRGTAPGSSRRVRQR